MSPIPPSRPKSSTIDVEDPLALKARATWLDVNEDILLKLVKIVGTNANQVEFFLGKKPHSRF